MDTTISRIRFCMLFTLLLFAHSASASAAPDLIIQDIWSSPDPVVRGESYTFYARVLNQGAVTASAGILSSQAVKFYVDGTLVGSSTYDDVAAGGNVVVSITVAANYSPAANHSFRADADADDDIVETSETNNSRTENWVLAAADLVVSDIWTSTPSPLSGQPFTIYALVANQGNAQSGPFNIGVYNDSSMVSSLRVGNLSPGTSTTLAVGTTSSAGTCAICVRADVNNEVEESNEANNERCETVVVLPSPSLRLDTNALTFGYSPSQKTLGIWNGGGGSLTYSMSANQPWIIAATNGVCSTQTDYVTVSIDVCGLVIGTHTGLVTIASSAGTSNVTVTVNIADTDGDQIPDGWEAQFFSSLANCNPNLDADSDGQNNLQEWIGGTNPTNSLSNFHITRVSLNTGGTNVVISWSTLPGRLYNIEWSPSATGPFLPLGSNLLHSTTNYSDSTVPISGFYRMNTRME